MKTQSFGFAALLFAGALVLGFCNNTKAQSYELSPVWSIPAETPGYDWIFTNSTQRGLAYNAATGNLLTTSRYPATNAAVYIHASSDGTHLGNLSTVNVFADINFPLNMIAVADDGVIYACNLTIDSAHADIIGNTGPFRLYRWANESAEPTVAYVGDPSDEDEILNHRRFGDSLSVRGSGVDTEILVGTRAGRIVIRFTTADGTNFAPQKISAPDLTAVNNTMTIAFGSGNTFWIKSQINATLRPLQHFSFDPVTTNAILIQNYTNAVFVGRRGFNFLGFSVRWQHSREQGRWYGHVEPSAKSRQRLRERVRGILNHWTHWKSISEVVEELNPLLRGWSGYFHYRQSSRAMWETQGWVRARFKGWLWRKHGRSKGKWKGYPDERLHERYGLWRMPTKAPWKLHELNALR
jgi:hypothetical protein